MFAEKLLKSDESDMEQVRERLTNVYRIRKAILEKDIEEVDKSLSLGMDPNQWIWDRPPLALALASGENRTVGLLLRHGANPFLRDENLDNLAHHLVRDLLNRPENMMKPVLFHEQALYLCMLGAGNLFVLPNKDGKIPRALIAFTHPKTYTFVETLEASVYENLYQTTLIHLQVGDLASIVVGYLKENIVNQGFSSFTQIVL